MTIDQYARSVSVDNGLASTPPPLPTTAPPYDSDSMMEDASCPYNAEHQSGKEVANVLLDMEPERVYNYLFVNDAFMNKILIDHKCTDIVNSPWQDDVTTKEKTRKVTFTMTLPSTALGPSTSNLTEVQNLCISKHNELYVVNKETTNAGIPYADNFHVLTHYCILKELRENKIQTRFKQYVQIKFKKSTVFFIKNMIEKNGISGAEAIATDIQAALVAASKGQTIKRKSKDATSNDKPIKTNSYQSRSLFTWSSPVWGILLLIILAGFMNTYLYHRLNQIESKRYLQLLSSRQLSKILEHSHEGPRSQYLEEEELYESHLDQWHNVIEEAIETLENVEDSLKNMRQSSLALKKRYETHPKSSQSDNSENKAMEYSEHSKEH